MTDIPSMKLRDLLARADTEPPISIKSLTMQQRAFLNAYGRARSVLFLGQPVTAKLVVEYAKDDWGYGVLTRSQTLEAMQQLTQLGWSFKLTEEGKKKRACL